MAYESIFGQQNAPAPIQGKGGYVSIFSTPTATSKPIPTPLGEHLAAPLYVQPLTRALMLPIVHSTPAVTPSGPAYGGSSIPDTSGKPLLTFRNDVAKKSQLLPDRTYGGFDPTLPQKLTKDVLENGRMSASASSKLKATLGGTVAQELDHIMPVSLGGSNQNANFRLENRVGGAGTLTPTDAAEAQAFRDAESGKISALEAWQRMARLKGIPLAEEVVQPAQPQQKPLSLVQRIGAATDKYLYDVGKQTVDTVKHPIEAFKNLDDSVKEEVRSNTQNLVDATQGLYGALFTKQESHAERIGATANYFVALGKFALAPVTSTFHVASVIPGSKPILDAIGLPFMVGGKATAYVADQILSHLPISQESKDALRQPIHDAAEFGGQLVVGGLIYGKIADTLKAGEEVTPAKAQKIAEESRIEAEKQGVKLADQAPVPPPDLVAHVADRAEALRNLDPNSPNYALEKQAATLFLKRAVDQLTAVPRPEEIPSSLPKIAPREGGYVTPFAAQEVKPVEGAKIEMKPIEVPKVADAKPFEVPRAGTELRPIEGTGPTKTAGLAKGIEAKAVEARLTKGFGDLPEYATLNKKDQANRAVEFVTKDYELAKRVARGEEAPPSEIAPESVLIAVENRAIKEGDVATLRDIATGRLTSEATTMGQRIGLLAERDPESPVGAIKDIQKAREVAATRRARGKDLTGAKKEAKAALKEEIKKTAPTKQTWKEFVESIQC